MARSMRSRRSSASRTASTAAWPWPRLGQGWLVPIRRPPGSGRSLSNFRPVDRDTGFLMPPSVDEWLPQRHLARFVVEVIEGLDLRAMTGSYRGCGEASYHPRLLLGILVYGYATGVFSSRKLERATFLPGALPDPPRTTAPPPF